MMTMRCATALRLSALEGCQEPLTSAILRRAGYLDVALTIDITPEGINLTPETQPEGGVWLLLLTSPCGCYEAPISVEACSAFSFTGGYEQTEVRQPRPVCCG